MFKKIIVFLIVVSFLFCYNSFSSFGVNAPSTIKEDIYLLNYDETINTIYLAASTSKNYYGAMMYNASPNSYFFKIQTNLNTFKTLKGKEIAKNTLSPIFAYDIIPIFLYSLNTDPDHSLGYLIIEIFSLKGERVKIIEIKNVVIPKGVVAGKKAMVNIEYKNGAIQNTGFLKETIMVNVIQANGIQSIKKSLKPKEKFFLNVMDLKKNEIVIIANSNSWSIFQTKYYILNKKISTDIKNTNNTDTKKFWCKDQENNIFTFLAYENVYTVFCFSEINTNTTLSLLINHKEDITQTFQIQKGWNKFNLVSKRSLIENVTHLKIDNITYNVKKVFVENHKQINEIKFLYNNQQIIFSTTVEKDNKFMILTAKDSIMYIEYLVPNIQHIPSYFKKKGITVGCTFNEVVIVELSSSLNMIKPTLSE